jgi:cardiolipin synthase
MEVPIRTLANQAFSRAAGAPLVEGNQIRLLQDARENYPAWLAAIAGAKRHVHFENYLIREDEAGRLFAGALIARARAGVRVRVLHDWFGSFCKASPGFWERLRAAGVEVRCYNPPRFGSPLGWISRDHRKTISVDGEVSFVTGLCIGQGWLGEPARGLEPWRDTGVEVRGPSVADIEQGFAEVWAMAGEPLPQEEQVSRQGRAPEGGAALRVVASLPATAGLLRVDELVAALARDRLWLTDAYFAGTTSYIQALRAAAMDSVDVRLLVPGGTNLPFLKPLSQAGYHPLLEGGVRVFEWKGPMLHAKTAVADGRWARVGSTNLNIASWLGNCEMDVIAEDEPFARLMEEMYLRDLQNATEVVLDAAHSPRIPDEPRRDLRSFLTPNGGSAGRVAAGAIRLGSAVGAVFTDRRVLEPVEGQIAAAAGLLLLGLAILFGFFPRLLAYPLILIFAWLASSLLYRGFQLHRRRVEQNKGSGFTP